MRTNKFSEIAQAFIKACSTIKLGSEAKTVSLDNVIAALPGVSKKEGYVFEAIIPGRVGMGGESTPYARKEGVEPLLELFGEMLPDMKSSKNILLKSDLLNAFDFEFTPEGVWSYILLKDLWLHLPLYWHANYSAIKIILDEDEYPDIACIRDFLTPEGELPLNYHEKVEAEFKEGEERNHYAYSTIADLSKALAFCHEIKLPKVMANDDRTIDARFFVWNDWNGLKRVGYQASLDKKGVIKLAKTDNETIFHYNCGICF